MNWLHEPCQEMLSYGLVSQGIPERMHPKSFRGTFEASTHVWATQQPRLVPHTRVISRVVAVFVESGAGWPCIMRATGRVCIFGTWDLLCERAATRPCVCVLPACSSS
jgi:hypothetical protein